MSFGFVAAAVYIAVMLVNFVFNEQDEAAVGEENMKIEKNRE